MPICPNCKSKFDPKGSYCLHCGVNLRSINPNSSGQISMKEKGDVLEDSVLAYFRKLGFQAEARVKMRDRYDVSHEIDVLASKKEDFGTINMGVECKYVKNRIDIKEIRNFQNKLSSLGIMKGIFVSTGGYTADATSHAKGLGIELWDMKTLEKKIAKNETSDKNLIHDAVTLRSDTLSSLRPTHLTNHEILSESLTLGYYPYYAVDYHCFSQHTVRGDSVVLESEGKLVLDGFDGDVVDSEVTGGHKPSLPASGTLVKSTIMRPHTVTSNELPQNIPVEVFPTKLSYSRAKNLVKIELVKNLTYDHRYSTTRTVGFKTIKPKKKDVELLNIQLIKIPLIFAKYRFLENEYKRIVNGSTGDIIVDNTVKCFNCNKSSDVICQNCGKISCESHSKSCNVCEKSLCEDCIRSKGIISKKHYCQEHYDALDK